MQRDAIKVQIRDWLFRRVASSAARKVIDLPLSIASDIGDFRDENQDRAVVLRAQVSADKYFLVGVLCDGMGGMVDGAHCAALAVASFVSSCIANRHSPVRDRLVRAIETANMDVFNEFKGKGGATLSAFILDSEGSFEAVNVGDINPAFK